MPTEMNEEQAVAESVSQCSSAGQGRDSFAIQAWRRRRKTRSKATAGAYYLLPLHTDRKGKAASCSFKFSNQF